jgi:hypothetical protein
MAKITPIYQFYTHEDGDILYAYNDETNMVTTDKQIGGLFSFIGQGVRTGWEVTKLIYDANYSSIVNEQIRNDQLNLINGYLNNVDSYYGRRITSMLMDPVYQCAAATTTNLSATYNSGSKTLTNNSTQQALQIDSINLSVNDYVVIKDQTTKSQNGIYRVTNVGSNSTNWIITRATGLDTTAEFINSRTEFNCFWCLGGTTNYKTIWTLDIDKTNFVLDSNNVNFQNAFEQCIRVTTGDGIVGLYKAKTEENVFFRYFEQNIYYVWAVASPCLVSESKTLIVSPLDPDYNYDSYNIATYLASIQVNDKFDSFNVYVDTIEYDDRRNVIQNLEGAFENALRKAFYRHVHLGGTDHPSKINLSTARILFAKGPVGTTVFKTFDENGNEVLSWNSASYGFPEVRLDGVLLPSTAYSLSPSTGKLYLKNSLLTTSIIQITLPLSPQKKLTIKPGSTITDSIIYLTDNLNGAGNELGGTGGSTPRLFTWDPGDYLEASVYVNNVLVTNDFYSINPGQGSISFDPARISSDTFYIILEKIGREVTGNLNSSRLGDLSASLFSKNELSIKRLSPMDHVGLVRYLEPAFLNPTKRLLSSGDRLRFFPEDTSQDLQYSTEIYKIATSINNPGVYYFGTKRGLFSGASLSLINLNTSWNPDNGEIIDLQDDIMRSIQVHVASNKFKVIYVLTNQGKLFRSFDQGSNWLKVKMPFFSGDPTQITANAFLVSTQIEPYEENNLIKYRYSTLLYLGTNVGLFTATIYDGESDADWSWSDAWSDVAGNKEIYAIGEIVTQRYENLDGSVKYYYDRTIYIGSDKGFTVHGPSGAYSALKLISSEPAKGFMWIRGQSANNLLWFTDNKVYLSHTARRIETSSTNTSSVYWIKPLSEFSTSHYSTGNKIECNYLYNLNVSSFSATTNKVDGNTLLVGDKILVRGQTNKTQNGIYEVTVVGSGSNGTWTNISSANLTTTNKWVLITSGDNWARSAWTFKYTEQSIPSNSNINIGTDLIYFEELYLNPIYETAGTVYFQNAVERTNTNKYIITSKTNPWILTDRRDFTQPYEWDYPILNKVNWNSGDQSEINSVFFNASASSSLYVACKEGLYSTSNIDNLLKVKLTSDLGVSDTDLLLDKPSLLDGYSKVEIFSATESVVVDINVTSSTVNGITTYSVSITSSPTRTNIFPATISYVVPISNNKKVTDVVWQRINKQILEDASPNIYEEQSFGISSDGKSLLGLVSNYTVNENYQIVEFDTAVDLGKSFIYENQFLSYYVDSWDTDANVFIYINDLPSTKAYSLDPENGKITFLTANLNSDSVKITILKLNKYLTNAGSTPHAELLNSYIRGNLLTRLSADLVANAKGGSTQIFVESPENIPLSTTLLDLVYAPGSVAERITVKVTTNSTTGVREIYLLNDRPTGSINLPASATEVYAIYLGSVLGIEDKITEAYSNHYYNFNSTGGTNLSQLSTAVKNVKNISNNLIYPKLFENFFADPIPVDTKESKRGPQNALFYDFSVTPPDTRNSSSTFYVGIGPSADNSPTPPNSFYVIHNPSSTGSNMRVGTNNGIWIYDGTNDRWSKETNLDGASKVYFIKTSDSSSYLMAGTDVGLFEQQATGSWNLNSTYPQAIYDHASGDWGTGYTFNAYGKNDGLAFVKTNTSTGEFISDHFDTVDEKNVYGLYKQKFYRLVDDGQGGVKQVLIDALYLCTNEGLFGVCEGARGGNYSSVLTGREMFGVNPNKVTISLPDGGTKLVSVKYYKIFNSPKPQKNNQPPVPIIILTSNGVFTVVNWRWCDPADSGTSDFIVSNHNLKGISCTCFATATEQVNEDKFIYKIYVGTNIGVFRSYDDGRTFERCERINFEDTVVNDIKSLSSNCILVATNKGLYFSNDEGDNWYKTDETPVVGDACTDIRSSIDAGEYFTNGLLAQTFKPATATMNKVSLYVSRDDVAIDNPALDNILTVGIYNTSLVSGQYVPNLASPIVLSNVSTVSAGYAEGYQENATSLISTNKFSDNIEFDKKTYIFSENSGVSGEAGITAIYDMGALMSLPIDKMITQVYYTQIPSMTLDYSDNGTTWTNVFTFTLPIHGGAGKWEDVIWNKLANPISAPGDIQATTMGGNDSTTTYSYKVTSYTYLGETTAATITKVGNSTLDATNYVRLTWSPVPGAIGYKVYGRTSGTETLLSTIVPTTSPVVYDDKGVGPAGGAPSPPITNTSNIIGSHRYYRLTLMDEIDGDLEVVPTRVVRIGDYRIYYNGIQYLLSEKISASEINYPGFKSFILNATSLSTSTTYALVARELDSVGNAIVDPDMHIIKWIKTNL